MSSCSSVGIVRSTLRIPFLGRRLVEVGIREQPQADDAGGLAVVGADRQRRLAAAAPIFDAGIFLLVLERDRAGSRADPALVEPQAEAVGVGAGGLLEARLVDQAEVMPAVVAAELQRRVGRERLQEIERADAAPPRCRPRSGRCPPVQTIQVLRPLTSSGVSATPPSMSWK